MRGADGSPISHGGALHIKVTILGLAKKSVLDGHNPRSAVTPML